MSTPVNYYIGYKRGSSAAEGDTVDVGTTTGGTAVDVEVRIQIDNGTSTTGITRLDVRLLLEKIIRLMNSNSLQFPPVGTDLPKL
jgi:hypothetical protein